MLVFLRMKICLHKITAYASVFHHFDELFHMFVSLWAIQQHMSHTNSRMFFFAFFYFPIFHITISACVLFQGMLMKCSSICHFSSVGISTQSIYSCLFLSAAIVRLITYLSMSGLSCYIYPTHTTPIMSSCYKI